jgi:hypothetical protein
LLSSYAVISYTENWVYVGFAAVGSWLGAFVTITYLHRPPGGLTRLTHDGHSRHSVTRNPNLRAQAASQG